MQIVHKKWQQQKKFYPKQAFDVFHNSSGSKTQVIIFLNNFLKRFQIASQYFEAGTVKIK